MHRLRIDTLDDLRDGVELCGCEAFWPDRENGETLGSAPVTLPPKFYAGMRRSGDGGPLVRTLREWVRNDIHGGGSISGTSVHLRK